MNFKTILTMVAVSILLFSSCSNDNKPQEVVKVTDFKNFYDSLSYSLGFDIGNSFLSRLEKDSIEININFVYQGIKDGLLPDEDSTKRLITKAEIDSLLMQMQIVMQEKQQKEFEERQQKYEERKKTAKADGEKFLEENKKKPDVIVEKSGLQYRVIKAGTGTAIPKATDIVKVHIVAKHIDGEEFQSTRTMDAPEIPLEHLTMPGMKEAISKMKIGDLWEIVCPPKLAYGDQETGIVPPNSVVVFEIELLDIIQPPTEPTADAGIR